jgi:hypothetical protein
MTLTPKFGGNRLRSDCATAGQSLVIILNNICDARRGRQGHVQNTVSKLAYLCKLAYLIPYHIIAIPLTDYSQLLPHQLRVSHLYTSLYFCAYLLF